MRSAETMHQIAVKFRRLAEEVDDELAAHLRALAEEYELMSRDFVPDRRPPPDPWERHAA